MSLNYFKDKVFELLDEDQTLEIVEIETNDIMNTFTIETADGSIFEIECRKSVFFGRFFILYNFFRTNKKCWSFCHNIPPKQNERQIWNRLS